MQSPQLTKFLKQRSLLLLLLWCFFTISIFVDVGIVYFLHLQATPGSETGESAHPAVPLLPYLAGIIVLAGVYLRRWLLNQAVSKAASPQFEAAAFARNPQTGQIIQTLLGELNQLEPREQRILAAAAGYFFPMFITWVLNEAVALLGLVGSVLGGNPFYIMPFALAALFLNGASFPQLERFCRRLDLHLTR